MFLECIFLACSLYTVVYSAYFDLNGTSLRIVADLSIIPVSYTSSIVKHFSVEFTKFIGPLVLTINWPNLWHIF